MDFIPTLPPNLFGKEAIFSLVVVVEKLLQVDMMTQNKTKPSCARVKVEVNLLGELPMGIKREDSEVVEKWIPFRSNYIPQAL